MMEVKKIFVTGHRRLANAKDVKREISNAFLYFRRRDEYIEAVSAMAAGADLIFAETALEMKIPLEVVFPFDKEEYKNDFDHQKKEWQRVEKVLLSAKVGQPLCDKPVTAEERSHAYLSAGEELAQKSDIILAVWDGQNAKGKGGTADIVKFADSISKEVHIIKCNRENNEDTTALLNNDQQLLFNKLDKDAILVKEKHFTPVWVTGILAGLLTILFFTLKGLFNPKVYNGQFALDGNTIYYFSVLEIGFLFLSFYLLNTVAGDLKNRYLKERRDAEYLRSVIWFRDAGIPIPKVEANEYKPSENILELEERIKIDFKGFKKNRFENAKRNAWSLAAKQIDYQISVRKKRNEQRLMISTNCLHIIKWTFICLAIFNFTCETMEHFEANAATIIHYKIIQPWVLLLLIMLPPVYASIEGVKFFGEYKKEIEISEKTAKELYGIQEKLISCDEKNFGQTVAELRKVLEMENNDWAVRLKQKVIEKGT